MSDDQEHRDRLTRLEERFTGVETATRELKQMIAEIGKELKAAFVPRGEYEERSRRNDERVDRLEARVRDAEAQLASLATRPAATPAWVQLLIGLVSILGGALITLIITLAIYYQAKP